MRSDTQMQDGGGWCIYDDWMLALRRLRSATGGKVRKSLYIDLDVHQVSKSWHRLSTPVLGCLDSSASPAQSAALALLCSSCNMPCSRIARLKVNRTRECEGKQNM